MLVSSYQFDVHANAKSVVLTAHSYDFSVIPTESDTPSQGT